MHRFPEFLLKGYSNFMAGRYAREEERYRDLAKEGQNPSAMIVACCDSRSAPETIFDCGPGELFVLRNIANLVPPYQPDANLHGTSAAIEFAVKQLEIKDLIIMGHGRCGGIHAALNPDSVAIRKSDFVGNWVRLLNPVAEQVNGNSWMTEGERRTALERISIRHSIYNLRTFPFIKKREDEGQLALHGAWFDISTGELWVMDPDTGDFERPDA
ncbi:carbonic anhydrase [Paradevosia shaoguanensis]|uniref:Carbonic anhydrase n=1 Tax=Paradevosia shaoguanensis TaxID=1335043 RepID=A0AA41UCG8_9HYPH|nr:carbonic anhydrase [Paradevosia shaoguanensis]MCF1743822.1 carbonic anhydrase [Paradevosia shaoguanensis]MCI0128305.1 carbonic anhydrase [Paradevosia shaoguanensis]QMV00222.1 carbonic anhydrase [Devosia sp. D6-9]CDP52297.1 Carbonic anhydrase [Devosia sp. DBB001]